MKTVLLACSLALALGFLAPGPLWAKPERIQIKSDEEKAREVKAEALAKQIDLTKIEDPDTRLALQAILGALDLDKKETGKKQGTALLNSAPKQ